MSYPKIKCARHAAAPGFAVCRHVLDGAAPALVMPATVRDMGQILCADCNGQRDALNPDNASACCAGCAIDRGWVQAGP